MREETVIRGVLCWRETVAACCNTATGWEPVQAKPGEWNEYSKEELTLKLLK